MLHAVGKAVEKVAKDRGILVFWQDIPPVTSIKKAEYGWEYFHQLNELASQILRKYGVHILRTEHAYYARKLLDPKVSGDGMHFCGPGPYSLNTMTFRLFLHSWMTLIKLD